MGVGNLQIGVKFSKVVQNCYKFCANTLLACLYTVSKSGVQNVLCLCLKTVANREKHLYIIFTFILVLQWVSNMFEMRL